MVNKLVEQLATVELIFSRTVVFISFNFNTGISSSTEHRQIEGYWYSVSENFDTEIKVKSLLESVSVFAKILAFSILNIRVYK